MDCHIRRSCCSAPVAFFHVGCFGSPAQPDSRKQTTKDTKKHKGRKNRNLGLRELSMQSRGNRSKHNKKGTKLIPLCLFVSFVVKVRLVAENFFFLFLLYVCLRRCGSDSAQRNESTLRLGLFQNVLTIKRFHAGIFRGLLQFTIACA